MTKALEIELALTMDLIVVTQNMLRTQKRKFVLSEKKNTICDWP